MILQRPVYTSGIGPKTIFRYFTLIWKLSLGQKLSELAENFFAFRANLWFRKKVIRKYPAEQSKLTISWIFFTDKSRILLIKLLQTFREPNANIFRWNSNQNCTFGSRKWAFFYYHWKHFVFVLKWWKFNRFALPVRLLSKNFRFWLTKNLQKSY